jgi:CrcB protein
MRYLMIGIGGFVGANARYLVAAWAAQRWGTEFPYGTFVINVAGSFVLGLFSTLALNLAWNDSVKLLVAVGFVGAFTTFSTFEVESLNLIAQGRQYSAAAVNLIGSVVLGLAAAFLGVLAGRLLVALPGWVGPWATALLRARAR